LERLLAFRDPNRPRRAGQELYDALVDYRMGKDPKRIAEDLGMNPYKSSPSEPGGEWGGTKEWKRRLEDRLERGAEIEEEKYPLAAAVFANRDKPRVQAKARRAYRGYVRELQINPPDSDHDLAHWAGAGDLIHVRATNPSGIEVVKAYVQLGSCLDRDLNPFPTHLDFTT
jgi:hypothetical protein